MFQEAAVRRLEEKPLGSRCYEAVWPNPISGRLYARGMNNMVEIEVSPWNVISRAAREGDIYETHHHGPQGRHVIYSKVTWVDDDGVAYFRIFETKKHEYVKEA
jgi:hypothetical protein